MNRLSISVAVSVLFSLSSQAQSYNDKLVVTASKHHESIDDIHAHSHIIDREMIESSSAQNILQLLRTTSGIDFSRTGGQGQQTSLFLRGSNSNHVLVLIDGVRVSSAHTGSFAWEHLNLQQVERIEIIKGPRAAAYGSDAIGGVIQIFTRQNDSFSLDSWAGSYNTLGTNAAFKWGSAKGFYAEAQVSYEQSQSFSAQNENGFAFDPDNDAYHHRSFSFHASMPADQDYLFSFRARVQDSDTEFDQGVTYSHNEQYSLKMQGSLGDNWKHYWQISQHEDELNTPIYGSLLETNRKMIEWHHHIQSSQAVHSFGLDYQDLSGSNAYNYEDSTSNTGLYVQTKLDIQSHQFTAHIRADQHSAFNTQLTGQLSWGKMLSSHARVYASLGTAFRAPTLSELYSPGFFGFYAGNPNLNPEESSSYELGIRVTRPEQALTASIQQTDFDQLIQFSGGETYQAVNIDQANAQSLEIEWDWHHEQHHIHVSGTWQNTENEQTGSSLLRRPDEKYSLSYQYALTPQSHLGFEYFHSGEADDFSAKLDAYNLVNLSGKVQLNPNLYFGIRLDNLFNEDYALAYGYNTPGRSGQVFINWRF